jgi:hypothetical protein
VVYVADTKKQKPNTLEDVINGISIAISFLVFALLIYMFPNYLGNTILSTILSIIFVVIGLIGLSFELSKLNEQKLGFDDIGIGLGLLIIWAVIHHYFPYIWVNWLTTLLFVFGTYGTILGSFKNIYSFAFKTQDNKTRWLKIGIFLVQLLGFGATILQYLTSFKFM